MQKGFLYVGIIYAIIYGICHLIVYFATRGYEPVEMLAENYIEPPKQTIGEVLKDLALSLTAFLPDIQID